MPDDTSHGDRFEPPLAAVPRHLPFSDCVRQAPGHRPHHIQVRLSAEARSTEDVVVMDIDDKESAVLAIGDELLRVRTHDAPRLAALAGGTGHRRSSTVVTTCCSSTSTSGAPGLPSPCSSRARRRPRAGWPGLLRRGETASTTTSQEPMQAGQPPTGARPVDRTPDDRTSDDRTSDDRTSDDAVSPRLLLWGVLTPLLVGAFVPAVAGIATVWLFCGLAALVVAAMGVAVRRADPGEDGDDESVAGGHWWRLGDENPNTAAARAGSWG